MRSHNILENSAMTLDFQDVIRPWFISYDLSFPTDSGLRMIACTYWYTQPAIRSFAR
jgi:hypothetical protein